MDDQGPMDCKARVMVAGCGRIFSGKRRGGVFIFMGKITSRLLKRM